MRALVTVVVCALSLIGAAQVQGQSAQYVAVDLSPTGFTNSRASAADSGQQVGYAYTPAGQGDYPCHAFFWTGTASSAVDLTPAGCTAAQALAAGDGHQAGWTYSGPLLIIGHPAPTYYHHAALWTGSAASAVDLNPAGFTGSSVTAMQGGQEVGYGFPGSTTPRPAHALLWTGTAGSAVDLHIGGFDTSAALGVNNGQQVGYATLTVGGSQANHAILWTGSAASAVDLMPAGCTSSEAYGVGGGQQVGRGWGSVTGNYGHAFLWSGSAASATDLNPSGWSTSWAYAAAGGRQVGYAENYYSTTNILTEHAFVWNGTAASGVDLHAFLSPNYINSYATGIDGGGNVVGYAWDAAGNSHAMEWIPVPEPATLALLALGGLLLARRRRVVRSLAMPLVCLLIVGVGASRPASADVFNMGGPKSLEFVTVGDAGNAGDTRVMSEDGTSGYGSVGYTYQMGKCEVTAAQYCQFLNAVARTDTYGLYNPAMATGNVACGIIRNGSSGNYAYDAVPGHEDFPVNWVSWGDAVRFANWLNNGQPTGAQEAATTEAGSYMLGGASSRDALMAVTRSVATARYVIPTQDEWYKAGHYKGGSTTAGYWLYPTQSNYQPSNVLSSTGANNANYNYTNRLTPVGAFASSPSPYGTFDQGGNVDEWTEAVKWYGLSRGTAGGAFNLNSLFMREPLFSNDYPTVENEQYGFRIALVPEPATLSLFALGGLLLARRRRA